MRHKALKLAGAHYIWVAKWRIRGINCLAGPCVAHGRCHTGTQALSPNDFLINDIFQFFVYLISYEILSMRDQSFTLCKETWQHLKCQEGQSISGH